MASTPTSTRRRPTAPRAFAEAALPAATRSAASAALRAQKGTDVFVDAMCRLLPRYPDFTAVIVGQVTPEQTAFANDLRRRIEAAGLQARIVITGELPRSKRCSAGISG